MSVRNCFIMFPAACRKMRGGFVLTGANLRMADDAVQMLSNWLAFVPPILAPQPRISAIL